MSIAISCGGDEPVDPTPPTPVTPDDPPQDNTAPTITISQSSVNVINAPAVTVSGNELKIGETTFATWQDDVSSSCTVALTLTPKEGAAKAVNS